MTRAEGPNADLQQPDDAREEHPTRALRKFNSETQALIRHLIKIGDMTAVVRNGELFIPLSAIEPYTAGGADPFRLELDPRHLPTHRSTRN